MAKQSARRAAITMVPPPGELTHPKPVSADLAGIQLANRELCRVASIEAHKAVAARLAT